MLLARRVAVPAPEGRTVVDHGDLQPILEDLRVAGIASLPPNRGALQDYRDHLAERSPDSMNPSEALAFWMNLYNAGALDAAAAAYDTDAASVLRIPGAFTKPWVAVDGERLSLNDVEHGKIRRFGDPRIHAALVCGSVSCPTLRYEPFTGEILDAQLDDQMRNFLRSGGASLDRARNVINLSRIFLWYGRDFTHPQSMPNTTPARHDRLRDTVAWWLDEGDRGYVWDVAPSVEFLGYDWALACSIARPARTAP